jgi:hypothetical protein
MKNKIIRVKIVKIRIFGLRNFLIMGFALSLMLKSSVILQKAMKNSKFS